jgi:hypothetical protein
MQKIKMLYLEFKGFPLNVDGKYTPWDDEHESSFAIERAYFHHAFSMGVAMERDLTEWFKFSPDLKDALAAAVIAIIEEP